MIENDLIVHGKRHSFNAITHDRVPVPGITSKVPSVQAIPDRALSLLVVRPETDRYDVLRNQDMPHLFMAISYPSFQLGHDRPLA